MGRTKLRHKKNTKQRTAIKYLIIVNLLLIGLIVFIISPTGNSTLRKISGDIDTPLDSVAKNVFISQVEKSESINNVNPNIVKLKDILKSTPMNKIVEASQDRDKAVELIKSSTSASDDSANILVDELLSNEISSAIIKDISNSKWKSAYDKFNQLQSSGAMDDIKENIKNAGNVGAQELQNEASEMLNK